MFDFDKDLDFNLDSDLIYKVMSEGVCSHKRRIDERQRWAKYVLNNVRYLISFEDNIPIDIERVEY